MDRRPAETAESATTSRRLVMNPTSGGGDHVEEVRRRAVEYGFEVVETERAGHAVELAEAAADDGVDLLAVAGGDGTIHEVVEGLVAADALDSVTLCVVPVGTANLLADRLGVGSIAEGFEVAERGDSRRLDLGFAGDEPFVLSAIAGLPADTSAAATHGLKNRLGSLAFVVTAVEESLAFDGIAVEIDAEVGAVDREWSGEAAAVLVGNARGFATPGGRADAEDGLLEVTIVDEIPARNAIAEVAEERLLDRDADHITELRARRVDFASLEDEPVTFSLDGEIRTFEDVTLDVRPSALRVRVGEGYEPEG